MRPATKQSMFLAWTGAALVGALFISACTNSRQAETTPTTTSTSQNAPTAESPVAVPDLKGKSFEYQVGDYRIRLTFLEQKSVHWEYLAAPNGLIGKNATETIESMPIRNDIVLLAWKEADGTQVLDVLDLGRMVLHANFVTASGERHSTEANVEPVQVANR